MSEREFHPLANMFPLLEGGDFAALVEDIRAHGLNEKIVLYEGMILDGRNRDRACRQAGVEPCYVEKIFGGHAEAVAFVISANIHRRHITTALERRQLIERLLKADPERSDRQIGREVDASHTHVSEVRRELEATGDVATVATSTDAKGRKQPRQRSKKPDKGDVSTVGTSAATTSDDPAASADARRAHYAAGELPSERAPTGDEADPAEATSNEASRPAVKSRSVYVRLKHLKAENSELRLQVRRLVLKERQLVDRVAELEARIAEFEGRAAEEPLSVDSTPAVPIQPLPIDAAVAEQQPPKDATATDIGEIPSFLTEIPPSERGRW